MTKVFDEVYREYWIRQQLQSIEGVLGVEVEQIFRVNVVIKTKGPGPLDEDKRKAIFKVEQRIIEMSDVSVGFTHRYVLENSSEKQDNDFGECERSLIAGRHGVWFHWCSSIPA